MARQGYAYVAPFFPSPENWRGAYGLDFVRALKAVAGEALDVHVFVPGAGRDYEIAGVPVHRFPVRQLPSNILPFLFAGFNTRAFLQAVQRAYGDRPIAVCHANTAPLGVYARALKRRQPACRTLLQHHCLQSFGLNNGVLKHCWLYNLWMFPVLRRVHEAIDCHVFISEAVRRSFLAAPNTDWTDYAFYKKQMRGLPYRPARIKDSLILPNGVDTTMFFPEAAHAVSNALKTPLIGCVANFEPLKDQETLLRAVKDLDCRVRFVGSGPTRAACEARVRAWGLEGRVEFLEEVRHEELPDFYRGLDLFVLPSRFEGLGCVYLEAAACGVPFVGCTGQGIADFAPDAWLVPPHDAAALKAKIVEMLKARPAVRLKQPVEIQALVRTFWEEGVVSRWREESVFPGCPTSSLSQSHSSQSPQSPQGRVISRGEVEKNVG